MKKLHLLFLLVLFINCSSDNLTIKKVHILSLPENMQGATSVGCDWTFFGHVDVMEDTLISNKKYISEFEKYFNNLKALDTFRYGPDVRIKCLVSYKQKDRIADTLCFGEFGGIVLNGQHMQNDSLFLEFIKKTVYPHRGNLIEKVQRYREKHGL